MQEEHTTQTNAPARTMTPTPSAAHKTTPGTDLALALVFTDETDPGDAPAVLEYERLLDELDAVPETVSEMMPAAWPPEGWPTEHWPPAEVCWLPEAHYNAALWEAS